MVNPGQLSEVGRMLLNWEHYMRDEILRAKTKCLERLSKKIEHADSVNSINGLSRRKEKILEDIARIQSNQYNMIDAYEACTVTSSEIWLKPPTVVIYDRTVWGWVNNHG